MPQLSRDGDDLGANDELIAFKDEGEQEEKPNVSSERDLDDVKSSLVNESETASSSDSEADRRRKPHPDAESRARYGQVIEEELRKQQSAGLYQPSPYVSYPFFMIPDLGNLCSPYLTNGALSSSGRTVRQDPNTLRSSSVLFLITASFSIVFLNICNSFMEYFISCLFGCLIVICRLIL
ncbi:hypothetical protein ILYODFUR_020778 [Ilyodon furcidens]|uniref:CTNNB1 binding N-teminal domain-containing protein n=1 Tax=Ilyodon furcidens TaxID=33524 RepID=A0ABV0UKP0_9TELE